MSVELASQEAWREELIGGKLVMMSPPMTDHNRIVGNIFGLFWAYLKTSPCELFGDGEIAYLTEEDHFLPDMMVVCDPSKVRRDGVHGAPDLVVEVLSPSTAKRDRGSKRDVYESCGVREYWIVSPGDKSVEVYQSRNGHFVFHDIYTLCPEWQLERMTGEEKAALPTRFRCSLFEDLEISLEDIFRRTF